MYMKKLLQDTIFRATDMWEHRCPREGMIAVGVDEPCNWCGMREEDEYFFPQLYRTNEKK